MVFERLRDLYRRGKKLDDRLSGSDLLYRVHSFLDVLMVPVLVGLVAVLYLEFFVKLTDSMHVWVLRAEKLILVYFILEILVDFLLYEENKKFFREKWLDILLVLPFFAVFKSFRAFRLLKIVKPGKMVKGAKIARYGKKFQHFTKFVKKSWEKAVSRLTGKGGEVSR